MPMEEHGSHYLTISLTRVFSQHSALAQAYVVKM
jgi:hypothetical protein